jgi:hypothetical protein
MEEISYGSWLTEDLIQLETALRFRRDRSEEYSDRVEYNITIKLIMNELLLRKKNG